MEHSLDVYASKWFELNQQGYSLRKIGRQHGLDHKVISRILRKNNFPIKVWHSGGIKDITNMKFGLITAVEMIEERSSGGERIWSCYCACNPDKRINIVGTDLRRGRKTHCGCNFPRKFNISGKKYGLLTAIRDSGRRQSQGVVWECVCDCSIRTFVTYGDLTSGHTKSCGCQRPRGENHHKWTGGSEIKSYLRGYLKDWKKDSLAECNNKCVISGKKNNLSVHHLNRSFIEIFYETLAYYSLPEHTKIGDYTAEELEKVIEKVVTLHYEYGFGIAITSELHIEFHKMYGFTDCTQEDFTEFVNTKKGL